MPDGNKIVQIPSGERIQFPATMADADINAEITKYLGSKQTGAMQAKPGGPVFNARTVQPPAEGESTGAKIARGGVLGAFSGAGIPETQTPVRDLLKNLFSSWVNPSDAEATLRQSPPVAMATGLATGFGKATEAVNPMLDNFFRWLSNKTGGQQYGYRPVDPEQTAHDLASFGTQLAMLKGGKEATEATGIGGESIKAAGREVMGEGKFKAGSLQYQHANAMATKQHLSGVADAVHTDAQQAMSQVLSKVDEANPAGAFTKAEIQDKVKSAMGDLVQVPEKMPSSVAKILKEEKPTWESVAAQKDVGGFVNRLRQSGLSDVELRETLRQQGFNEREIGSAMKGGAATGSDMLTAEQLKQMRSDVGQELGRYDVKGVVGAGLKKVYGLLSQELRNAAKEAGVEKDWLTANDKYSQYANDFIRGPLKDVLGGETASDIMEPLTGATRQQLTETLQKYRDAGFDVDTDWVNKQVGRYGAAKKTLKMAEPGKWDLILAGLSPKTAALRQGIPRLAGSPKTLDVVFGKGAEMPPRQVYPSKAAALKAKGKP